MKETQDRFERDKTLQLEKIEEQTKELERERRQIVQDKENL